MICLDVSKLKSILPDTLSQFVFTNEPLKNHTSIKIGGNADILVTPRSIEEIIQTVRACNELSVPHFILGNGTNLLFADEGFRGVVIKLKEFNKVSALGEDRIIADAGALLSAVSSFALNRSLSGLEYASGIPGTIGGAVYMNAGAYGYEMSDVVDYCLAMDKNGGLKTFYNKDLAFGYRSSIFRQNGYVVLEVACVLKKANAHDIKNQMDDFNKRRRDSQPLSMPSAGSAFKRPAPEIYAGKLISDSGLKGFSIGDAQVSDKHAGFIVNKGNATSKDVCRLIEHIKRVVFENSGILLEPEIIPVEVV